MIELDRSVTETLSWRLAATIVRRHPQLTVLHTHPGGGQYDCLSLLDEAGAVLDLNRLGSIHLRDAGHRPWTDWLTAHDPAGWVSARAAEVGLRPPPSPPPAEAATLTWRVLACGAAQAQLTSRTWRAVAGLHDSSGMEGSHVRDDLFEAFPAAAEHLRGQVEDHRTHPAADYWFVIVDGQPQTVLHGPTGSSWSADGTEVDLMVAYRDTNRSVAATTTAALAPALP